MYCDELYTYCAYKAKPFLEEISKRYKITYTQLINMTHFEIQGLFEGRLSDKLVNNINMRIRDSVYLSRNKKIIILVGKKLEKYLEIYHATSEQIKNDKLIEGESACPGIVKGVVQLIEKIADIKKFKKNCILVTSTTIPQYLPAMKKAKAFITDEGGLLSHAAIMSREFKKPCIIGTKIATQVLKDGDLVEVDANKGIVKKLNK